MSPGGNALKSYDLVFILRPDLEQDALKAAVDRLTQRITDQGGTLEAVAIWGKKRMLHTIKKYREGVHVHIRFAFDPQRVSEVRRAATLMEDVLRVVLTNAVGKLPEPAVVAAAAPPAAQARDTSVET